MTSLYTSRIIPFQVALLAICILAFAGLMMPHTTHALPPSSSEIDDDGTEPDGSGTPTVSMTASPSSIETGYSSRLFFNSAHVTRCVIDNGIGIVAVNRSDSRTVSPTVTTTYTISCDAPNQVLVDNVTISVVPAPTPLTAYCEAGPDTAQVQETVQWSAYHLATGPDTASYSYAWTGTDSLSGTTQTVSKAYTTTGEKTGRATVTRSTGGSASATCTARISPKTPTPTATLSANPSSITAGSPSTLTWGSTNASTCSLNESIGAVSISGTRSVSPGSTTTYTLMCTAPPVAVSGTWQYRGSDVSDFACPVTVTNRVYSSMPNCPNNNPQGQACSTTGACKVTTVQTCNIHTDLYKCSGSSSSPSQAATASATVTVTSGCTGPSCLPDGSTLSCAASPATIAAGGSTTWTASPVGPGNYSWTPSETSSPINGGQTLVRTYGTAGTYAMSVSNRGATASCSNNVTVSTVSCGTAAPSISASPTRVQAGSTSVLTVSASGVDTTCVVSGPGVSRTISGSSCTVPTTTITTGAITSLSTYTISCDSGESSASVLVNVVPKIQEF